MDVVSPALRVAGSRCPARAARRGQSRPPGVIGRTIGRGTRWRLCAGTCVAGILLASCSPVLPHGEAAPSAEAAAEAVLDALERRDRDRLRSLALAEQEFRERVWPRLPASRPERNLPFSYVWGDLRQKSEGRLAATLARHGGRSYELAGVTFAGVTDYGTYRVHREATLHVRDGTGAAHDLRLFGSMIEQDGRWKVFSYVTED